MTDKDVEQSSLLYESLFQQNQALREELAQFNDEKKANYALLVGTTRRLQATSTSIKAAVSSLLNYDILWDASNQHEFLETINISIDLLTHLVTLMALRFRIEAGDLEFNYEKHSLQEIISSVQVKLAKNSLIKPLEVSFCSEGKPVNVDYGYLIASLELLISAISRQNELEKITIVAEECAGEWLVRFTGINPELAKAIQTRKGHSVKSGGNAFLSPECILELYTALDLLTMQGIQVNLRGDPDIKQDLHLSVPVSEC